MLLFCVNLNMLAFPFMLQMEWTQAALATIFLRNPAVMTGALDGVRIYSSVSLPDQLEQLLLIMCVITQHASCVNVRIWHYKPELIMNTDYWLSCWLSHSYSECINWSVTDWELINNLCIDIQIQQRMLWFFFFSHVLKLFMHSLRLYYMLKWSI